MGKWRVTAALKKPTTPITAVSPAPPDIPDSSVKLIPEVRMRGLP
jgi:hypothetical protein